MWLLGVTFVGGLVIAAALVVLSTKNSSSGQLPVASPAQVQQLLSGVPQHGNTLGNPSAPLKITEFADLQCPYCMGYERSLFPTFVQNYVRTGKAYMVLELSTKIGPDSTKAAEAAIAAGQQNKLWNFADNFYNHQGTENTGYVTDAFVARVAGLVPGLNVAQMMSERSSPSVASTLSAYRQAWTDAHVKGTPTFILERAGHRTVQLDGQPGLRSAVAALVR
jgi:protein-disulfide isomerase